ncbi:hypothetical protein C2E23DRAFT_822289 [Lenzites betulinus]|nr:hypothetical protein C2E23DRAFT_822289 [Lenzites betulinus]
MSARTQTHLNELPTTLQHLPHTPEARIVELPEQRHHHQLQPPVPGHVQHVEHGHAVIPLIAGEWPGREECRDVYLVREPRLQHPLERDDRAVRDPAHDDVLPVFAHEEVGPRRVPRRDPVGPVARTEHVAPLLQPHLVLAPPDFGLAEVAREAALVFRFRVRDWDVRAAGEGGLVLKVTESEYNKLPTELENLIAGSFLLY